MNKALIISIVTAVFVTLTLKPKSMYHTIGMRNNNPGNLRPNGEAWQGLRGTKNGFMVFNSMSNGIRAFFKNQRSLFKGNKTLSQYISVYAPSSDNNNPKEYTNFVALKSELPIDVPFELNKENQIAIAKAQFAFETGNESDQIPHSVYEEAYQRSL